MKKKISREKALKFGKKWLEKIVLLMYKTCYVFDPKVDEKDRRKISLKCIEALAEKYIEEIARQTNRGYENKNISEKNFIKVVVAVESAIDAITEYFGLKEKKEVLV